MIKTDLSLFVQKFPQNVRDHLFSDSLAETYANIQKEFHFSVEQAKKLSELIWQVYFKGVAIPNFISEIEKVLGLSKELAKKLGIQIIGFDFLPIADWLVVDIFGYLKEIGADPNIFVQTASPQDLAREILESTNLHFSEERLNNRLQEIIVSRFNNVRDDMETKSVLTRSVKLGGLELGEEAASRVLALIKLELDSLSKKRVVLKEEKQSILAEAKQLSTDVVNVPLQSTVVRPVALPPRAPSSQETASRLQSDEVKLRPKPPAEVSFLKSSPRSLSRAGDILMPDEKAEVAKLRTTLPKTSLELGILIKQALAKIYEASSVNFTDPLLKIRFETVLTNRLKDIRDSIETRNMLFRAVNLGGVGLSAEQADKVASALDAEFSRARNDLEAAKESEIKGRAKQKLEQKEQKQIEAGHAEKQKFESRWQKLIKPRGKTREQTVRDAAKSTTPPISSRILSSSPPAPNLEDVKYTQRLVGPLEELADFSVDDFRKISPKPKEAIGRLLEKLEILRSESMEKRIAGIDALRNSPLHALYAEILAASLSAGQNPRQIIAARFAKNESTLSEEEFSAIMELSSKLRY